MRKNERLEWISKTEALFEKWARAFAAEIKRTLKKRISHTACRSSEFVRFEAFFFLVTKCVIIQKQMRKGYGLNK